MRIRLVITLGCFLITSFASCQSIFNPSQTFLNTPKAPSAPTSEQSRKDAAMQTERANKKLMERDLLSHEESRKRQEDELREVYRDLRTASSASKPTNPKIRYAYKPNKAYGLAHFEKAYSEIVAMLEKKSPYNLKRAVFLAEHAYDTTLNYVQFERQIAKLTEIIQAKMKKDKISPRDNIGKIMTVFQFMADTIHVRNKVTEKNITTYPKTYDFEDFSGVRDYRKMFVSKLIRTGKGQCHSLPLLFLILCQEINAKAYLSYSPEHCYVKFKDKTGTLQNIELTNQMFTSDQFVMQSGYIKASAIKSKIYMDTLGMDKMIVHTLGDLANTYVAKYGTDDFVLKCSSKMLQYYPNSLRAHMQKANYYIYLGLGIEKQYQTMGMTDRNEYFARDERLRQIATIAMTMHNKIDELGWTEMPADMYSKWLGLLKSEDMKQQYLERRKALTNMIEH